MMILAAVIGVILMILSAAAVAIETAGRYMCGERETEAGSSMDEL